MKPPKAIVFDIGNVLLEWDPDKLYAQLIPDADARQAFYDASDMHRVNEEIDCGAPFKQTIYAHADANPKYSELIRAWHDRWPEMATPLIAGSWDILRKLRADGIPVFALSNFGVESFELAETLYPELKEFDARFISGQLKCIKPAEDIYTILEKDTGYASDQLFFIDDRADNIAAAQARGWHGHIFTTPQLLRQALDSAMNLPK